MEIKKELVNAQNNRVIYLDILRILATFAVITLHVSATYWIHTDPSSYEWNIFNIYDSIVRWAVPIFVMISGAIFLDNNRIISTKKIYTKYILRIATAFIFWSLFYQLATHMIFDIPISDFNKFIGDTILGNHHLWFLHMIIGLYIITPVLRKITIDIKTTEYFLIISLIFTFVIPSLLVIPAVSSIITVFSRINLNFGYITYFILGYYLSIKEISNKTRKIIYAFSILGFIVTILGSTIIANYIDKPYGLYDEFLPNVLLQAIGIFVFIKKLKLNITPERDKTINLLSKYSFGIYLVHDFIITILRINGVTTLTYYAILSVPIIAIATFVISTIISAIINHIPILKKYIV